MVPPPRLPLLLALIVAVLPFAGCGPREKPADRAARGGRFLMVIGADPQVLDPHVATGFVEYQVFLALFEGLTALDPVTCEPVPGAAERWEISDDGLVYTFHLRPAARWSNGDPVTAEDFAWSMRRILTPSLGSEYAYFLHYLKNGRAYHEGRITDFGEVGVRVLGPHTLQLTLERPTPYFPALLMHQAYLPVHQASVEAAGAFDDRSSPWARPGRLIGNGPFILTGWTANQRLTTARNPHYHGAAAVRLNAVEFLPMESADTGDRAFRAGQVHVTDTLPLARIPVYRAEQHPDFRSHPYLGTAFLTFNTRRAPFTDLRVRRAFSLATDRETLVARVTRGGQVPSARFTPPGTGGYEPPPAPLFDPEAARRLLADAGFAGGAGFPPVEVTFPTADTTRTVLEAMQEMWRRELGVEVRLVNVEWKVFLDQLGQGDYQAGFMAWIGDYVDPNTFLSTLLSNSGNNRTGWASAAYDELLERAAGTADPGARYGLLREAEALLLAEQPIMPLWHLNRNFLLHPAVRGFTPNLMDLHPYHHLWLEPPAGR